MAERASDLSFFASFKAKIRTAIPEDLDKQTARLVTILQSWDEAKKVRTIRASFQMAGFIYNIAGNSRLVVSFSRTAVRNQTVLGEQPPPRPVFPRVRIQ